MTKDAIICHYSPWEGEGRSVLDRIVALRSAVRTMGGYSGALKPFPWSTRPPEASVTSQKGRSW